MKNIQIEGRTIEPHCGRNVDKAPALLARWERGEGYIPSEADIRLLGVRNFKNAPEIANNYWDTSTLSATKGDVVKVILPYETGSRTLTEVARFGLSLIDSNEGLVQNGIDLDIDNRWERYNKFNEKDGVYTKQRDKWFEKGKKGKLIGLNDGMTEQEARRCPLLLTKLQHPDYVDGKFARSTDEVEEIIADTFELGKKLYGYKTMMAQYCSDVSDKGVLKVWYVGRLSNRARSYARAGLDYDDGRFAFISVGDANANVDQSRVQLKTLEGILKPEQISQIGVALDERDKLRAHLLTTDKIYSVIRNYIGSANESEVRKILSKLTGQ